MAGPFLFGSIIVAGSATLVINCREINGIGQNAIQVSSGSLTVNPGCTISRDNVAGSVSNCVLVTGGTFTNNSCIITSALDSSTVVLNSTPGVSIYNSSRVVATGANSSGVSCLSGTTIMKGLTIVATGSGKSIVNNSTVKAYGACETNLAVGSGVTVQVGFLTIDSNVN